MRYLLDVWDTDNERSIAPGLSTGALFQSDSPIPIPNVGELLTYAGQMWTVHDRRFDYSSDGDDGYVCRVALHCTGGKKLPTR